MATLRYVNAYGTSVACDAGRRRDAVRTLVFLEVGTFVGLLFDRDSPRLVVVLEAVIRGFMRVTMGSMLWSPDRERTKSCAFSEQQHTVHHP